ncbi:hypothetical protein GCK72_018328 [Caenorhabditis remanei]|uniref:Uncharacterized protein n=1 Tax=Caenorhabditis remanei TaxID=31234 RepID=A0A6A5GAS5_CAERE|nr:hypothetical protein GCK72_018328 [Caenorhabditis remanei]KAF1751774.1 hypothetical protein GCK72_018328 [Caenorhabditis remanei]
MSVSTPLLTISSTPPSLSSNHHGMALIVCEGGCGLKGNKICRFLLHCLTGTRPHTQASSEGEKLPRNGAKPPTHQRNKQQPSVFNSSRLTLTLQHQLTSEDLLPCVLAEKCEPSRIGALLRSETHQHSDYQLAVTEDN